MSCKPITFRNISPDTFKCMKKKLQDYGIHVPPGKQRRTFREGNCGEFRMGWKSRNLTITIKEKPFFVSCEIAASKIKQFVIECHGS